MPLLPTAKSCQRRKRVDRRENVYLEPSEYHLLTFMADHGCASALTHETTYAPSNIPSAFVFTVIDTTVTCQLSVGNLAMLKSHSESTIRF